MNCDKIITSLLRVSNLELKFHVKLKEDNKEYLSMFEFHGRGYMKLNADSYITLEIKSQHEEWSKDNTFMIHTHNIIRIIKNLNSMVSAIYNANLFYIKDTGELSMYGDIAKEYEYSDIKGMVIKPAIVYDPDEVSYEGCVIMINKTSNMIHLSIDQLEVLVYVLEKINIPEYTLALLNQYRIALEKGECVIPQKEKNKEFVTGNVFKKNKKDYYDI